MKQVNTQSWSDAVAEHNRLGDAFVLITLLNIKGSAPRDAGTKLVVSNSGNVGSIGGGNLEYMAINHAKNLLNQGINQQQLEDFVLGEELGQCCGGRVSILFECFAQNANKIVVFGAGHVARALMPILEHLPVNVSWVDSRASEFPDYIAPNIEKIICENPVKFVADIPKQALVIIMTHDHSLDYDIAVEVLKRGDARYLGIIGSLTKARRFRNSFSNQGFSEQEINSIKCPIGLSDVPGKRPMEVAVSIAADVVITYSSSDDMHESQSGNAVASNQKKLLTEDYASDLVMANQFLCNESKKP